MQGAPLPAEQPDQESLASTEGASGPIGRRPAPSVEAAQPDASAEETDADGAPAPGPVDPTGGESPVAEADPAPEQNTASVEPEASVAEETTADEPAVLAIEEAATANLPEPAEEPVEEGAPAWVMTFGDLMSLLLTFFILLFSMSSVETEKFRAAAQSLQEAFGNLDGQGVEQAPPLMSDSIPILSPGDAIVDDVLSEIRLELQAFITDNGLEEQVLVAQQPEGVFLRIQSQALFQSGNAGVETEGAAILDRLGEITRLIEVPVSVTGHTDNTPVGGNSSNWELSATRAAGVARALVDRGQDARLVTVEGYGEHRPIASNETPEGRAQNRRVELYYSRQGVLSTLIERGLIPDPQAVPAAAEAPVDPAVDATPTETAEQDQQ